MYIPALVLKTLKTPEALRFEQTRRALKQAVADAKRESAQCVKPFKHPHVFTPKENRDWAAYLLAFNNGGASTGERARPLLDMPHLVKIPDIAAERQRRYDLTLAYQAALIAHPAKLAALRLAEQSARAAYTAHVNSQ